MDSRLLWSIKEEKQGFVNNIIDQPHFHLVLSSTIFLTAIIIQTLVTVPAQIHQAVPCVYIFCVHFLNFHCNKAGDC